MNRLAAILALAGILAVASQDVVFAGECVDPEEDYVAALEKGLRSASRSDSFLFEYAIGCLANHPIVGGHTWAGPRAGTEFASLRADTLRPRLRAALSALLASSWADSGDNRHVLVRIAARRGIARVDSVDVFAMLLGTGRKPYFGVYEEMAVLQDCRAVDFLRARYQELRLRADDGYHGEILDLLSCLYHIPCEQAVLTAVQLYAHEQDRELRGRLKRVVDR